MNLLTFQELCKSKFKIAKIAVTVNKSLNLPKKIKILVNALASVLDSSSIMTGVLIMTHCLTLKRLKSR